MLTFYLLQRSKHPGEQNSHSNFAEAWQVVITLVLVNQKSCHKNAEVVFFYVLEAKKKSFKNTTFVPFKVINILEYKRYEGFKSKTLTKLYNFVQILK